MNEPTLPLYCANHPKIETSLRCNNCGKPICHRCAVLTPTGYRCRECVRNQQKVFDTARWHDYPVALLIAALLSFLGSYLASLFGFFTLFIAPGFGILIGEAVRLAVRRRRSYQLFNSVTLVTALASLPLPALALVEALQFSFFGFPWFRLLWHGVYLFLVTSSVYYRLRGIYIR